MSEKGSSQRVDYSVHIVILIGINEVRHEIILIDCEHIAHISTQWVYEHE
jgi:hypothetical protein